MGEVIGLATSQTARNVLVAAGVTRAYNTARFLGHLEGRREALGPLPVPRGSLLILDEASMMSLADMAAILALAREHDCKVIITGDHEQLAAVEGGGAMLMLARRLGYVQLLEPQRFTHAWERDATLRLRTGDTTVLALYDEHGRLRGGTPEEMTEQAYRGWLSDYLDGIDALLVTRTQDQARELSRRARDDLILYRRVAHGPCILLAAGEQASAGDLVMARRNTRALGDGGELANRDVLRIITTTTGPAGDSVVVRRLTDHADTGQPMWSEPFEVPRRYLAEHGNLAYATTAHAALGRTVGTTHVLVDGQGDRQGLYVGLSRGRNANYAYCITELPSAADVREGSRPAPELDRARRLDREQAGLTAGETAAGSTRTPAVDPVSVLAGVMARDGAELTATETLDRELSRADHLGVLGGIWDDLTRRAQTARFERAFRDALPDTGLAGQALDDPARTWLWRNHTARTQPRWAVRTLGPVPADPAGRLDWEQRASVIAAYRERYGYPNPADAIGPEPGKTSPEARAAWHGALAAMGRVDGIDLRGCTDGELWLRRSTYQRETAWAPPHVGSELRVMRIAGHNARVSATRAEHEAVVAADEQTAARHRHLARIWRALEAKAAAETAILATAQDTRAQNTLRPADYALVRTLVMLATVTALAPHAAVLQQVLLATRWLARATNWLAWLFSTPSRKASIRSKASGIGQTWLSSQTVGSLQRLLAGMDRVQQLETEPGAAVAEEWRASSPSLLASLERLLSSRGSAVERAILDRGLATRFSSDLLDRIQRVVLNTSRLVLQLRPYQEFGTKFAVAVHGGLLGDDMGLGKCIQALAAIAHATDADGQPHHLVVCPASLIDTWLQEIGRALTGISGWRFHGPDRDTAFYEWQAAGGILVTSFQQAEHLLAREHPRIGFAVVDFSDRPRLCPPCPACLLLAALRPC